MGRRRTPAGQISPSERRVLEGLACGLTLEEIAAVHGIAQRTATEQAWSARKRLGAKTVMQAVALATLHRLIEPLDPAATPTSLAA